MVNVLIVHGRSRPLFGPAQMREQWLVALHSAFSAADIPVSFADDDVKLPWYGDALSHLVGGVTRGEAERVSRSGDLARDERAFVLGVVQQVAQEYAFTPDQLASVAAPQDAGASSSSWGYVRTVLSAVDRYVPGMSGTTVAFVARECFGYLTDARLRQMIDDGVANVLSPGVPTVVLGHSLGAVIAYHVLRAHPDAASWDVPLFVTLGAPLAWWPVLQSLARLETLRVPGGVRAWVNARDPRDAVAIGGALAASYLPAGAGMPSVTEVTDIVNPDDGRHAIEYYLADPALAQRLGETLGA